MRTTLALVLLLLPACTFSTPLTGQCKVERPQPYVIVRKNRNHKKVDDPEAAETILYIEVNGTCE